MPIRFVQKSSGYRQKFNLKKLKRSIANAIHHAESSDGKRAERLAHEVLKYLDSQDNELVNVDTIRQSVLRVLKEDHDEKTARAYELVSLHLPPIKITRVLKRNGREETFQALKLFKSLKKSFAGSGIQGGQIAEEMTKEIVNRLEKNFDGRTLPIQIISKLTAELLKERGFKKVERSYLLHKYL